MRNAFVSKVILGIALCSLIFCSFGCSQPGETRAEIKRRHLRNVRLNQQQLIKDLDTVLLMDEPSKLIDKRIP